jgi:hypothetical protein
LFKCGINCDVNEKLEKTLEATMAPLVAAKKMLFLLQILHHQNILSKKTTTKAEA